MIYSSKIHRIQILKSGIHWRAAYNVVVAFSQDEVFEKNEGDFIVIKDYKSLDEAMFDLNSGQLKTECGDQCALALIDAIRNSRRILMCISNEIELNSSH
jgi:hypothetical protein